MFRKYQIYLLSLGNKKKIMVCLFWASANEFDIFWQCSCIVFILQFKVIVKVVNLIYSTFLGHFLCEGTSCVENNCPITHNNIEKAILFEKAVIAVYKIIRVIKVLDLPFSHGLETFYSKTALKGSPC